MGTLNNTASLILCIVFAYVAAVNGSNYLDLIEHISINCGSVESFSDGLHGNDWLEDDLYPKKLTTASISIGGSSISSRTANADTVSVDSVPYKTARISRSTFSYRFQLDPGQKYIRLHFNPASYNGFQKFRDLFNVEANHFTLLSHFSPSITAKYLGVGTLVKEFCVSTQENQPLDIVFSRSDEPSSDNYAFVNGIEIISIPAVSPYCHSGDAGVQVVGQKSVVYVDDNTALELVQSCDLIAGRTVFPFYRTWTKRSKEKESTWKISVDVGFRYLVKLHFAEFGLNNFTILVNRVIVCTDVDIIQQRIEKGISWHKNYMVIVQGSKQEDHRDILISIYIKDGHMPLEGFEVFKLSNHDDNLASRSSLDFIRHSISQPSSSFASDTTKRTVALVAALFCLINIIVFAIRKICVPKNLTEEGKMQSTMDKHLCRCFSSAEIKSATNNFDETLIVGRGGFGNVYKGLINEEKETVAIKRLRPGSRQGKREFWAEIKMLSALRHVNLVSLIGYCDEEGEMILVYEHMTRGTLASYLYKLDGKIRIRYSLSWKERLLICIGAGRGLDYLHTGHRVMHRDVKSSNILLDENFVAKFSDFGLAKTQIGRDSQTQDSTNMKGTVGYIDPDYCRTHTMTRKSDIYSFGVVLLEVLCGRKAIDRTFEDDRRSLIFWARENLIKGDVDTILDPRLRRKISPGSLKAFLNIAERCLDDAPKRRPRMAHVVMNLEFALQLQENVVQNGIKDAVDIFPCVCKIPQETTRTLVPNERSSYGVLFSRKIFPSFLNVTAPQATTTGQLLTSAPQNKNGKQFSKLKLLQFWPFDAFRNKAKSSKDFAAFSVSATVSQRTRKEPASTFNRALGKFEQSAVIGNKGLLLSPDLKVFSFSELKKATSNFSEDKIKGRGGFGTVYKGWLLNGKYFVKGGDKSKTTIVAIKKSDSSSKQGLEQWQSELKHLGGLSHPNLIKLLGYCRKKKELLLVYEFMEKGTLESHLFSSAAAETTLSWDMRLKILIGVARGLAFLHGLETKIIHRDVKPANILLDESYNPKLSDFGLAKSGPTESNSYVSTIVAGTFGYLDPEYVKTGHLYVECDTFAFGVCVLETLTGLRATHRNRSSGPRALSKWVNSHLSMKQRLNRVIIDPRLKGNYPTTAASQIAELALNCVAFELKDRPPMRHVLEILDRVEAASDKSRQTKVTFL